MVYVLSRSKNSVDSVDIGLKYFKPFGGHGHVLLDVVFPLLHSCCPAE